MSDHVAYPKCPPESLTSSVDYFTAYWSPDDRAVFPRTSVHAMIDAALARGERETEAASHGVNWKSWGQLSYGERNDERWIRCSGQQASDAASDCLDSCTHVSRVDLASTARYGRPKVKAARSTYEEVTTVRQRAGGTRKHRIILSDDGGECFYSGSRRSDVYCRYYDHGVAHGYAQAGLSWRWEVEYKGKAARSVLDSLRGRSDDPEWIGRIVVGELERLGYRPRYGILPYHRQRWPYKRSTVQRQLDWLRDQVGPTVAKLAASGEFERVLTALRLTRDDLL